MSSKDDEDYRVGYRRPPVGNRFKKGTSGNPKGRPKMKDNFLSVFDREFNRKIVVSENGQSRKISKLEAFAKQIVNRSLQGDAKVTEMVFKANFLREARELHQTNNNRDASCRCKEIRELTPEENERQIRIWKLLHVEKRPPMKMMSDRWVECLTQRPRQLALRAS